jgi:hypothetical protein
MPQLAPAWLVTLGQIGMSWAIAGVAFCTFATVALACAQEPKNPTSCVGSNRADQSRARTCRGINSRAPQRWRADSSATVGLSEASLERPNLGRNIVWSRGRALPRPGLDPGPTSFPAEATRVWGTGTIAQRRLL